LKSLALIFLLGTYGVLLHIMLPYRIVYLSDVLVIKLIRFVNMFAHFANYVLILSILLIFVVEMFINSACFMITFHTFAFLLLGSQLLIQFINPLNAELNPICHLLALLGAHHFLHVNRIRVKLLTLRLLMSYIYIYIWSTYS